LSILFVSVKHGQTNIKSPNSFPP